MECPLPNTFGQEEDMLGLQTVEGGIRKLIVLRMWHHIESVVYRTYLHTEQLGLEAGC